MVFYTKFIMRLLLFLQRITFICNILFLLCLIMLYTKDIITGQGIQNYIILLGWVASIVLGIIVNLWEVILLLNRKPSATPVWLRTCNFIFLITQLLYHSV